MISIETSEPAGTSPDSSDRIQEFLARHGGPGQRRSEAADSVVGVSGWSEVYAADGYTLRCEWSRSGERQEMQFTELPPKSA
jgi:hypothetical protein